MRMLEFCIQNYKKINDTGWIKCSNLTVLVGKNEAGKSAIFRALSKMNPSDNQPYDGLREFPRHRHNEFDKQDWPVCSVKFELNPDEQTMLSKYQIRNKEVVCIKYYSGKIDVKLGNEPSLPTEIEYRELLEKWHNIISSLTTSSDKSQQLQNIKQNLLNFLTLKIHQLNKLNNMEKEVSEALINEINNAIMSNLNERWQQELFKEIVNDINDLKEDLKRKQTFESAKLWIRSNIPKFVYFDNYDVIDSAIHIPNFIQQLQQNPNAHRVRTTKCLFQHVGLDINKIQQLDPTQPNKIVEEARKLADERYIMMSSASEAMTRQFSEWWEQRKHRFRYHVDGPYFRIWVSDDLSPSEVELEQRSLGLQYFFSFYLVLLEETKDIHKNAILLLDEPGLHLHGTAQQKLVKFLEKLSEKNQILYSTHSPFMIDGDHLENVRIVYEDENDGSTKVSTDVWPKDKDALFPLQAGLGYSMAQTLFYSKYQLIVEGLTDYWILKTINEILSNRNMKCLRKDIIITPAGGVRNIMPLASILIGNDVSIVVLLDGDNAGKQKGKQLTEKLQIPCILLNDIINKNNAELEDLFPEEFYLDVVKEVYNLESIEFTEEEKKIENIIDKVEAMFKRMNKDGFEKWKCAQKIVDKLQDTKYHEILQDTFVKIETIFDKVNTIL